MRQTPPGVDWFLLLHRCRPENTYLQHCGETSAQGNTKIFFHERQCSREYARRTWHPEVQHAPIVPHTVCIKTQFTLFFTLLQSLQVYGSKNIYICKFGETLHFKYIIILLEQTTAPKNFKGVKKKKTFRWSYNLMFSPNVRVIAVTLGIT